MTRAYFKSAGRLASALIAGGLIWTATALPAAAQSLSSAQILKALAPPAPPVTRSLSISPGAAPNAGDQTFIEGLRHHANSLNAEESDRVATLAKDRPKIDLEIYFEYNSAAISPKAEPQLKELGEALNDEALKNAVIVLGGHTDAKGSDQYNQGLSQRRSEAVKTYLMQKLRVSADNLTTAGYGKRDLKNRTDPFAAENRRVEIVNMSAKATASR
ncbi:MAG TPA: OmpA family protein [Xanthobacteraceae bacterium]|jgi:outer membrane protein OmpA-like peptidoglycan-associated protein|nr:OmpA family protein [Xanthobacteraceae bacterium]